MREIGSVTAADDECWIWVSPRTKKQILHRYSRIAGDLAHRLAFELATGKKVRPPKFVCHSCDVPACFNPAHLFEGDVLSNNRDKIAKGRDGATREAVSRASKGKPRPDAVREKIRQTHTGQKRTEAHRRAISAAMRLSSHTRRHVAQGVVRPDCEYCGV